MTVLPMTVDGPFKHSTLGSGILQGSASCVPSVPREEAERLGELRIEGWRS
jgi:hypothetical protein